MEDPIKDQSSVPGKSNSKLRYPLRSATKSKDEKPPPVPQSSALTRERTNSTVSQSVGVLDLSAKGKPAKPPRRLSIPAKSSSSPVAKQGGNIAPISEVRGRGFANGQGKSETPGSDISRASCRKKFSILSSASYWLSQIKLSESASKHSVSLGFFKLALEAGCEPLQRMRDELKSYARRQNLTELGEPVKELFESFNIKESLEQLQVSETCSQVPEGGTHSSDDDVVSSTSSGGSRKLKPKSLNIDCAQASSVIQSAKETAKKKNPPTRTRRTSNKTSDNLSRSLHKKPPKQIKKDSAKEQKMKQGKKCASEEGPVSPQVVGNTSLEENKENTESSPTEEMNLTEVI